MISACQNDRHGGAPDGGVRADETRGMTVVDELLIIFQPVGACVGGIAPLAVFIVDHEDVGRLFCSEEAQVGIGCGLFPGFEISILPKGFRGTAVSEG